MNKQDFFKLVTELTSCPLILKDQSDVFDQITASGQTFTNKHALSQLKKIGHTLLWRAKFNFKLAEQSQRVAYNKTKPKSDRALARAARRKARLLVWEEGKKFRRLDKQYPKTTTTAMPFIVF